MTNRQVRISWNDDNGGLAIVEIERSDNDDTQNPSYMLVVVVSVGVTEYIDTVSDNSVGKGYLYRVRSKIGNVYSQYSNSAFVFVEPPLVVHTPTGLSVVLLP